MGGRRERWAADLDPLAGPPPLSARSRRLVDRCAACRPATSCPHESSGTAARPLRGTAPRPPSPSPATDPLRVGTPPRLRARSSHLSRASSHPITRCGAAFSCGLCCWDLGRFGSRRGRDIALGLRCGRTGADDRPDDDASCTTDDCSDDGGRPGAASRAAAARRRPRPRATAPTVRASGTAATTTAAPLQPRQTPAMVVAATTTHGLATRSATVAVTSAATAPSRRPRSAHRPRPSHGKALARAAAAPAA